MAGITIVRYSFDPSRDQYVSYETRFTAGPESDLWVPVDFETGLEIGIDLGQFDLRHNGRKRRVECHDVYPFGHKENVQPILFGTGTSDKIEHLTAEDLLAQLDGTYTIVQYDPNKFRAAQLKRLGIDARRSYSLAEYVRLIGEHLD